MVSLKENKGGDSILNESQTWEYKREANSKFFFKKEKIYNWKIIASSIKFFSLRLQIKYDIKLYLCPIYSIILRIILFFRKRDIYTDGVN